MKIRTLPYESALFSPRRAFLSFGLLACLAAAPLVQADTNVWFGPGAGQNNWSSGANWTNATTGTTGTVPASIDDIKFFDIGGATTVSNIDNVVDAGFSGTIGSLQYGQTNGTHTTFIADGTTLSITGAGGLAVFTPLQPTATATAVSITNTVTGPSGTLNVNNSSASLVINQGNTNNGPPRAVLDLSGLGTFKANINRIGLGTTSLPNTLNPGGGTGNQRNHGMLYLAATNLINLGYNLPLATYQAANATNALELSRNPGNNPGALCILYLGQTNAIYLDSLGVGRDKASASAAGLIRFGPAFATTAPTAYFRGISGDSSRVTWWALGDMNGNASSSQVSIGTNDFTGGTVDALVNVMSLARDCSPSHTASATIIGVLTFTAGTINVNTLYAGNQSLGPATSTTPLLGIVNVNGPSATLVVNNNLVLGNTTFNSTAAQRTTGMLNINNGTVLANAIAVGAVNTNSVITMTNGTLVVSNAVASLTKAVTTLNITNSSLQLNVTGSSPNVVVTNLVTGGTTNVINPASVALFSSYPAQVVLIKYYGAAIGGVGYNFGFGANTIPPTAPGSYLSNNVANQSIDLVLPYDPRPVITSEPVSYSGSPGDNVTFTAGISPFSATPLSYQWYLGTTPLTDGITGSGSTISGSLTPSLAITGAQPGDNGNYTLIVTNLYGPATSAPPANLTISSGCVAPTISGGPNNTTVIQGNNATLTATVAGSPVPALQWRRGGVDIQGATTASYTVTNAEYPADDQAMFSLVATNTCGGATNTAILTVIVPPTISVQPTNLVVTNGNSANFYVSASGVPAPGYTWLKNNTPITGNASALTSTLTIASASPADIGNYSVQVTNAAGSIVSSFVSLTVNSSTLALSSQNPANGATAVCYDTPLYLTFNQVPVLRTAGKIQIFNATNTASPVDTIDMSQGTLQARLIAGNGFMTYPVIISGNAAAIYPHLGVMTSNQTYYVTIDDGVFADSVGAYFAGISPGAWSLTTKAAGPGNSTNLVVAADGSGDFATVQGAVDYVPSNSVTPRVISIRNGTYTEIVNVNTKNNLDFRGQSANGTIVSYANNNNINGGAPWRAMFIVNANDCFFENLTLTNSTPHGGSQAEAVDIEGTRATFCNVRLDSYQDTFLTHNAGKLLYFQDCYIQGDTDFNWGYGTVFYTNCELHCMSTGSHVTQPRSPQGQNGMSFVNCRVTVGPGVTSVDLGRSINTPTTPAEVIFIGCLLDDAVTGYASDAGINFWYSSCSNLTATVERTNLVYAQRLLPTDPTVTMAQNATNWLYGWAPQLMPNIITQPVSQSVAGGAPATFTVSAYGVPVPAFQWLKNGTNLPGASAATLAVPAAYAADAGSYAVVVSNSAGSLTSTTVTLTVGNTAPSLAPVTDQTVNVGVTVSVTNVANDPDVPPQTLTFTLVNGPSNATVDGGSGVFTWRPLVSQAGSSNLVQVAVTDNGTPNLSATNSFNVFVNPLSQPDVASATWTAGQLSLTVAGQTGPDYAVQASTNLADWLTVFRTNSPAMPFQWSDPDSATYSARFYRIIVGPPLP